MNNNWQSIKLDKCVFIDKYSLSEKTAIEKSFYYIDLSAVSPNCINIPKEKINFGSSPSRARRIIHNGDILFATVRPYLMNYALINFDASEYIASTGFAVLSAKEGFDIKYIYQYLFSNFLQKQINNLLLGSNYPALNNKDVKNLTIFIPKTFSEQHRIVAVLETWDKAISLTKRLIEQKEIQKKHLMRQLLTGKTRLKGFSGKWEKHILSDFTCRITRRNTENNKNIVTISAKFGFIPQTNFFTKNVASSSVENYFLIYKNEFCYNKSYSLGYPSGTIKRLKDFEKSVVTPLYICFAIKDNKHLDYDFFEQYCETGLFNRYLDKIANEGGRAHGLLNVSVNDFFKLPLNVPSIKEQQAIAEILSVADKEISLLKEKLAKLQQQKKGLMQILLTGKVRLN